jgi:hypothetical protein
MRRMETLLLLAPLPLAMVQLFGLWSKDAYRFVPLLLIAIVYLLKRRLSKYGIAPDEHQTRRARFLIAVALVLVASSILLASPWLATAAMICMLGGVFSRVVGGTFRRHVLPIWWLLWFLLPPPFGLDLWLVHAFDEGVRKAADAILDLHGYVHWLAGDVLQTTDGKFVLNFDFARFVTPFACMAFAAVLAVRRRRSFLQAIILVLSAVWWLGLGEVLGIVAVPVVFRAWSVDLTTFWLSLVSNGAILAIAVLLVHSTDVLFKPMAATALTLKTVVLRFTMRLPRRFRLKKKRTRRVKSSRRTRDAAAPVLRSEQGSESRHVLSDAGGNKLRSRRSRGSRPLPPTVARVAGISCVVAICLQLVLIFHGLYRVPGRAVATKEISEAVSAAPRELGTWERAADAAADQSQAATEARSWRFSSTDSNIETILTPLSSQIQEVNTGHSRQGWNVYQRTHYPAKPWRMAAQMPQTEIDVVNPNGEAAWLVYGAIDSRGNPRSATVAAILASFSETPASWLLQGLGIGQPATGLLYGLQFLITSEEPLSSRERESVRQAYRQFIGIIRNGRSKG